MLAPPPLVTFKIKCVRASFFGMATEHDYRDALLDAYDMEDENYDKYAEEEDLIDFEEEGKHFGTSISFFEASTCITRDASLHSFVHAQVDLKEGPSQRGSLCTKQRVHHRLQTKRDQMSVPGSAMIERALTFR